MALALHMNPEYMKEIQKNMAYSTAAVPNVGQIAATHAANRGADAMTNIRAGMGQKARENNLATNRERWKMGADDFGLKTSLYNRMLKGAKKDAKTAMWINVGNMLADTGMSAAQLMMGMPPTAAMPKKSATPGTGPTSSIYRGGGQTLTPGVY